MHAFNDIGAHAEPARMHAFTKRSCQIRRRAFVIGMHKQSCADSVSSGSSLQVAWCANCKRAVAWQLMADGESANTPFEMFYLFFRRGVPGRGRIRAAYDAGCHLLAYALNRDPEWTAQNLEVLVDSLHFAGHSTCAASFNTGAFAQGRCNLAQYCTLPVSSKSASCGMSRICRRTVASVENTPAYIADTNFRSCQARYTLCGHSLRRCLKATTLSTTRPVVLVAQPSMQCAADHGCASVQASTESNAWAAKQTR